MGLHSELKKNQTILYMLPSNKYSSKMVKAVKPLTKGTVLYITLSKTHESVKQELKKKGVKTKNIFFVDAITKTIRKAPKGVDDCIFTQSPAALTELSLAIGKLLKLKFDYVVFDSVSNLLVYTKEGPVTRFLTSTINKIKESESKAIFVALPIEGHQQVIKQVGTFVDSVVKE